MPELSEFRVLHTIRVRGLVPTEDLSEEVELPTSTTTTQLQPLERRALIVHRSGRVTGWTLTSTGRQRHGELLADEHLDDTQRTNLEDAYHRFVALNEPFKMLCTEWQTADRPQHCIPKLHDIHRQMTKVAQDVAVVDRMHSYQRRLEQAIARLDAGDHAAFTAPLTNSYHDVWMQLHQDLLLTLQRERTHADGH